MLAAIEHARLLANLQHQRQGISVILAIANELFASHIQKK